MIYHKDARSHVWDADVMITDPPYREHVHASTTSCAAHGTRKGVRQNDLGFDHLSADLLAWTCSLAARVSRWSVIFTDIESVGTWQQGIEAAGGTYIRAIPWVRWSMPQLSGDRPPQGCEMLVIAYGSAKGKKRWNGPGNLICCDHLCLRGEGKHRTEKPLDLGLSLVSWFSDEVEKVIDPFAGSGTFVLAAEMLGRRGEGTETQEEWATKANARLDLCRKETFSSRDEERIARWLDRDDKERDSKKRMAETTAKVRKRSEQARQQLDTTA